MTIFANAKMAASTTKQRGSSVEVRCRCGKTFRARLADRNRGWGRFCSKRCKAKEQEARTGQFSNYINGGGRSNVERVDEFTHRIYAANGGYLEVRRDEMTGEVEREQFNRHGLSEGFQLSLADLARGGYNNAGPEDDFGEGKW